VAYEEGFYFYVHLAPNYGINLENQLSNIWRCDLEKKIAVIITIKAGWWPSMGLKNIMIDL